MVERLPFGTSRYLTAALHAASSFVGNTSALPWFKTGRRSLRAELPNRVIQGCTRVQHAVTCCVPHISAVYSPSKFLDTVQPRLRVSWVCVMFPAWAAYIGSLIPDIQLYPWRQIFPSLFLMLFRCFRFFRVFSTDDFLLWLSPRKPFVNRHKRPATSHSCRSSAGLA